MNSPIRKNKVIILDNFTAINTSIWFRYHARGDDDLPSAADVLAGRDRGCFPCGARVARGQIGGGVHRRRGTQRSRAVPARGPGRGGASSAESAGSQRCFAGKSRRPGAPG